ncbi:MAG: sensor domain-containing diguanylate cyclase [Actinomycetes bacterium]
MAESTDAADPRLTKYREYLDRFAHDHLDKRPGDVAPPAAPRDEVAVLGESIISVTSGFEARFTRERQFAEVAREIAQGVYLDEVLDNIFESFRPIIPYDRIGCALLERDGTVARSRWARTDGREPALKVGFSAQMSGSSLQAIINTGEPRIINDLVGYLDEHPGSMATKLIVKEGVRSSLTCPLIAMGRPVGFLFFSSNSPGQYDAEHEETFVYLADLVSIAIDKSLLYEKMSTLNKDLLQTRAILEHQARHDSLTGLLNHSAIIYELAARTDKQVIWPYSDNRTLAVMMIDIDRFKLVNDTFGHPVGDEVLRSVAAAISSEMRSSDRIGRYGGEEFLVVSEAFDTNEPQVLAERLRSVVESGAVTADGVPVPVTVSIGLAQPRHRVPETSDSLLRRADSALYRAKRAGRNRVVID